jgi:hypothetical protein
MKEVPRKIILYFEIGVILLIAAATTILVLTH